MKNKGIKIGVVFILLFALLSVAGCQQEDVVIVGAASGQPGPTSGQLRIGFTLLVSKGASTQPSRNITINDLSLSADTSFTVTNTDTNATTVLTNVAIDTDPAFTHVEFDANGKALSTTRVSLLVSYALEPGNYEVTAVTGSINFLSLDNAGNDIAASHSPSLAKEGIKNTFTIAAPELTPTPEPTATPTVEPTATPTAEPTATPTAEPTATPTAEPTATPTAEPTAIPTAEPTATPTAAPTAVPTAVPTATPSPTNHPKTGDDFAPALWLTLCAGSLAALALLLKKRHI
ncbi:PT domain-containing protein [Hominenteromicrobium sp.]|uniref:PT domain-containing protein n=1 Tax=Hominenteromicrobium sp. TaxID=3073581 RepID=UPI003A926202